jgi:hypothetical protein
LGALVLGVAAVAANADDSEIVMRQVDPYATAIVQLEFALALSMKQAATIDSVVIWVKCGHYDSVYIRYSDGVVVNKKDTANTPVNRAQLALLVAGGKTTVVDEDDLFGSATACPF